MVSSVVQIVKLRKLESSNRKQQAHQVVLCACRDYIVPAALLSADFMLLPVIVIDALEAITYLY